MGLRINDTVPNFTAETDQGTRQTAALLWIDGNLTLDSYKRETTDQINQEEGSTEETEDAP